MTDQAETLPAILPPGHAGRADYEQLVSFRGLEPDEPYFLVRAKDAVAGDAVRAWVVLASAAGAPPALLEQALRQADRLDAWPVKRVADAGHLTEAEQKQLVYCLGRRAWSARDDATDLRVFFAEQRALTQARAELRPLREAVETAIAQAQVKLLTEARQRLADARRAIDASHATDDPEAAARFRDAAHTANGHAEGLARAYALLEEAGNTP